MPSAPVPAADGRLKPGLAVPVLLLVSAIEIGLVYLRHAHHIAEEVGTAEGIVQGTPTWRVFQSRVLVPFTIEGVAELGRMSYRTAYFGVMAVLLAATNACCLAAFRAWMPGRRALARTVLAAAIFAGLQDTQFDPWDPADAMVSCGLLWLIARRGTRWMYGVLFLVALPNRESSAFIGLWLLIEASVAAGRSGRLTLRRPAWPAALAGVAMIAGTILFDRAVRAALFIREAPEPIGQIPGLSKGHDLQVELLYNINDLVDSDTALRFLAVLCVDLFYLALLARVATGLLAGEIVRRRLALFVVLQLASIPILGILTELRVFSGMLPLLIVLLDRGDQRGALPGRGDDSTLGGPAVDL